MTHLSNSNQVSAVPGQGVASQAIIVAALGRVHGTEESHNVAKGYPGLLSPRLTLDFAMVEVLSRDGIESKKEAAAGYATFKLRWTYTEIDQVPADKSTTPLQIWGSKPPSL